MSAVHIWSLQMETLYASHAHADTDDNPPGVCGKPKPWASERHLKTRLIGTIGFINTVGLNWSEFQCQSFASPISSVGCVNSYCDGQISIKACPRRLISRSKMEYSEQVQGQNLITGRRVELTDLVDAGLPSCEAQWKKWTGKKKRTLFSLVIPQVRLEQIKQLRKRRQTKENRAGLINEGQREEKAWLKKKKGFTSDDSTILDYQIKRLFFS